MALVLDAGALIGIERGDRAVLSIVAEAQRLGIPLVTSSAVVAQVWRGGSRQARLARFLGAVAEEALGPDRSRPAGELLGRSSEDDVVDASLVGLAADGDEILTGDLDDLARLVQASGRDVLVTPI
jgi:hypothetical protein